MTGGLSGPLNTVADGALTEVGTLLSGSFGTIIISVIALILTFIVIAWFKKAVSGGQN